ncbi:MAG: POTRA domain-containing protein [Trueperaceae bacterium]
MLHRRAVFVVLVVLSAWASAQNDTAQNNSQGEVLAEVRVEGTTAYADIVRVVLGARAGTAVGRIDLEAERNRVYALGTFSAVSVSVVDGSAGPVLLVRVEENPLIGEVAFDGATVVSADTLRQALEQQHLLAVGRVYNTTRAEEALATVQQLYRRRGFPFDVPVSLDVQEVEAEGGDGEAIRLTYSLSEEAPVSEVRVEESAVLAAEPLQGLFRPLTSTGEFDYDLYRQAVGRVEERYRERGYRFSGVDLARSELQQGVLDIALREARIASIDSSAIGVDASELSVEAGDLFNYNLLLDDVRRLAQGRSGDVQMVTRLDQAGDVRVSFEQGPPETAGPVDDIEFEGNTVIPDEELRELLALEVGDTFTSTLAQEDFERIVRHYQDDGWVVLNQPDFGYSEGTYVQRIEEVRVAGYQVTFEGGDQKTMDFVVTRYMPEIGTVLNQNEIRASLRQLARLGAVEPVNVSLEPTDDPQQVLLNVIVRETRTGLFTPSAQYATDSGLSASLSFSESNFLGRAHNISAELNAQTSDLGFMLGGSVRYSIPWLYLDVLDFQEVPTSVSGSLFSLVDTNKLLTADGSTRVPYPGLPDTEENRVLVGEYSQRDTGASFSVGRPIATDTTLRFSARASVTEYKLEPPEVDCTFDDAGDLENANRCALPGAQAVTHLPQGGLSSFMSTTVTYDDRDSPEFPRSGIAATGLAGIGIGTDYRDPGTGEQRSYVYEQVEFGVKTYVLLADLAPEEISDRNHVLAFRANLGHQFGGDYPSSKRFQVGKSTNEATAIRGYQVDDFDLSRTYLTASAEYRYDFGLDTVATQTVIGIVFVDLGYASSVPGYADYTAPLFAGAGVGVQVNLGFGGVLLPALRFDYGFSERNPTGEFRFRVGPVF